MCGTSWCVSWWLGVGWRGDKVEMTVTSSIFLVSVCGSMLWGALGMCILSPIMVVVVCCVQGATLMLRITWHTRIASTRYRGVQLLGKSSN
jgi:hypothetical protein